MTRQPHPDILEYRELLRELSAEECGPGVAALATWLLFDAVFWRTPDLESAVVVFGWALYRDGKCQVTTTGRVLAKHPEITASEARLLALRIALRQNRSSLVPSPDGSPLYLCGRGTLVFRRFKNLASPPFHSDLNQAWIEGITHDPILRDHRLIGTTLLESGFFSRAEALIFAPAEFIELRAQIEARLEELKIEILTPDEAPAGKDTNP